MTIQSQHRINLAKKETMKKKNIKEKQLKLFNILQQKLPSEVAKETATENINQFLSEVIEKSQKELKTELRKEKHNTLHDLNLEKGIAYQHLNAKNIDWFSNSHEHDLSALSKHDKTVTDTTNTHSSISDSPNNTIRQNKVKKLLEKTYRRQKHQYFDEMKHKFDNISKKIPEKEHMSTSEPMSTYEDTFLDSNMNISPELLEQASKLSVTDIFSDNSNNDVIVSDNSNNDDIFSRFKNFRHKLSDSHLEAQTREATRTRSRAQSFSYSNRNDTNSGERKLIFINNDTETSPTSSDKLIEQTITSNESEIDNDIYSSIKSKQKSPNISKPSAEIKQKNDNKTKLRHHSFAETNTQISKQTASQKNLKSEQKGIPSTRSNSPQKGNSLTRSSSPQKEQSSTRSNSPQKSRPSSQKASTPQPKSQTIPSTRPSSSTKGGWK